MTRFFKKLNKALSVITAAAVVFSLLSVCGLQVGATANEGLSAEETSWVSAHGTLKIGYTDDFMPLCGTDAEGNATGAVTDVIPLILKNLGLSDAFRVTYVGFTDSEEMYTALSKGQIDIVFPAYDDASFGEERGVLLSSGIISLTADIVRSKTPSNIAASVAVNRNNPIQEFFVQTYFPDSEIVYTDSIGACLDAVKTGEADFTVVSDLRADGLLSPKRYSGLEGQRLDGSFRLCFAVRMGNTALLSLLNRGIDGMDGDTALNYAVDYLRASGSTAGFISTHTALILAVGIPAVTALVCAVVILLVLLKKTRRRLADAHKAKTTFLFNMSHDIRTPMNAIVGFTDMALKSMDNRDKLRDSLLKLKQSNNILISLINSILEMSRIESGNAALIEEPGDVRCSFADIAPAMEELARDKGIALTFETGDIMDAHVYMDRDRTTRIFLNLITNAVSFTERGGHVKVRCEQFGQRGDGYGLYRYTVADDGIGMSEEFQKHIFDEFSKENNSTATGIEGTGLGLSVVKAFVHLMKGSIDFTSKQGEGTVFTVLLPFRLQKTENAAEDEDAPACAITPAASEAESGAEARFAGKKVLVVEDNELNREIATFVLTEKEMIVEEAADGTEAVERLQKNGPDYYDFILMDIQMPTMNGYEATKAIRKMYPNASIPIIALSANAFAEDKASSLAAGMNDHIAKPINTTQLFTVLAKYLKDR